MFQARGQHYCEGAIWQIWGTVKYISMWLSHNRVVRYHLLCQCHTELNSKVCHRVNTVHMLNSAWSPLILGFKSARFQVPRRAGVSNAVPTSYIVTLPLHCWSLHCKVCWCTLPICSVRGKEKEVLVTFGLEARVRVEMLRECAISFCHNRFCGESLMVFLLLLVVISNQAEYLNSLLSLST